MVIWKNTENGELPYHGQYVIIDVDGTYHITIYNANTRHFVLNSEPFSIFEIVTNIRWTDFKL
jgi:hypothetical protein